MKSRQIKFITAIFSLIILIMTLPACSDSDIHESSSPEPEPAVNRDETDTDPVVEVPGFDPEKIAIEFMESLGYDMSWIVVAGSKLLISDDEMLWEVMIEDGFGPMANINISEISGQVNSVKFITPTGEYSPDNVKPGDDLPERIVRLLKLGENGYIPAPWISNPIKHEFRKYVEVNNQSICTHQVILTLEPETGGLMSIHLSGSDLNTDFPVETDLDTASELAVSHIGDPDLEIVHAELIQMNDYSIRPVELKIYWELTFENGLAVYVDSANGTILSEEFTFQVKKKTG